jgi:Na+/H+ antiporter NhaD/arsenite permease-like protein
MVVVSAFESLKVMDGAAVKILSKCSNLRLVGFVMLSLTFFSSMLVTNDVALITFVPLTLIISKKANIDPLHMIIFQTLAANIGSSLTPMGNPQNLFLFSLYKLSGVQFFRVMIPFVVLGVAAGFVYFVIRKWVKKKGTDESFVEDNSEQNEVESEILSSMIDEERKKYL